LNSAGLLKPATGRGWLCGCNFFALRLAVPRAPLWAGWKNSGLIIEPIFVYQKYAGVGFIIVLCLAKATIFV